MPGLVLFLHGLAGNQHSWGSVPDYVQSDDFDIDTPTYSASIRSPADVKISAQKIITEIETRYPNHNPIYLIGHSLGGLIAREICRHLLEKGPDTLLNKIPAVITVGTPLEGARFGNRFLRRIPFLSPKIHQIATNQFAFDNYRVAIRAAKQRRVNRPKQLHIQMEEDGVIARQQEKHFTEDDRTCAVIPGTHTNFNADRDSAKYVAEVLMTQIRNAQNSLSAPNIPPPAQIAESDLPDRLILIACSHGKRPGGQNAYNGQPVKWISEPAFRQRIVSRRSYVYSILKDGKLADGFERGGNRAHQPANQTLQHGSDLGGTSAIGTGADYLPAWQRYNGRIYVPVSNDAWSNYLENRGRVRVLIMSGLYGLIEPEELIQNYDVHLTDTHIDSGTSVSSMWTELYTQSIETYIRHAHRNQKVRIFNLLCDHHYVDAIKWHALSRDCSVFHLASPTIEDVDLLPPAGTILNAFLKNPDKLEEFDPGDRDQKQYELSDFGAPPQNLAGTRIIFESRVGLSKAG